MRNGIKEIFKNTCIFAALMILCVFAVSIFWMGMTPEILLVLELFGLALVIAVANYLFDEVTNLPMLISYIAKYFGVTAIVMLFGFIAGWFYRSNFWMAFIYVAIVFVCAYLLDSIRIKRDLDYINSKIKSRES